MLMLTRLSGRQQLAVCLAAVVLAAAGAAGCAGDGDEPLSSRKRDKVTYVTGLGAFGREGFAWVAKEKGFFRDQGIDVEIKLGAAGENNLKLVASGQAQFALIDYAGAVVRAGNGNFDDFRLIGAVNPQTLISLMTLKSSGITGPKDLAGKRIGQATGAVPKTLFPSYARLAGVDPKSVTWVETTPQALPGLLAAGKVDAVGQFVVGKPAIAKAAGPRKPVHVLPYSDVLTDLYGNVLVTSADLAKRNPDLARRFTTALMQGLRYAVDHPEEAGEILHRHQPTTDPAIAAAELLLMRAYTPTDRPGTPAGAFDPARVARSVASMQSAGLIPAFVDPTSFVDFTIVPGGTVPTATLTAPGARR